MTNAPLSPAERAAVAAKQRRRREVAAAVIGALLAAFALLNLGEVRVDWIFTTAGTPLIVVIVLSVLLGVVLDRMLIRRNKRQRAASDSGTSGRDRQSTAGRS